jgi:hypothetical protein
VCFDSDIVSPSPPLYRCRSFCDRSGPALCFDSQSFAEHFGKEVRRIAIDVFEYARDRFGFDRRKARQIGRRFSHRGRTFNSNAHSSQATGQSTRGAQLGIGNVVSCVIRVSVDR